MHFGRAPGTVRAVTNREDVSMAEPTRREQLEDLRDILCAQLRDAPPSAVAGIAREYRMTLAELAVMGPAAGAPREEGSKVDELSARRDSRRKSAATD